jgi:hypothetical protein
MMRCKLAVRSRPDKQRLRKRPRQVRRPRQTRRLRLGNLNSGARDPVERQARQAMPHSK